MDCKIVDIHGDICYCKDSLLHKEDGPAMECKNGDRYWYVNGKRHREDGPAIVWYTGDSFWYLNGIEYSEEEYKVAIRKMKVDRLRSNT